MAVSEHALATAPQAGPRKGRFWRRVFWTVGLTTVIAPMILAWAGYWMFRSWVHRSNEAAAAELQRVRDAGEPTTPEELDTWREAQCPDQTLTRAWLTAFDEFDKESIEKAHAKLQRTPGIEELPTIGETWESEDLIREILAERAGQLESIRNLASRSGAVLFPVSLDGVETEFPHVPNVRWAAVELRYSFYTHIHDNQIDDAITDLAAMRAVRDTMQHDPFIVSQLVRIAIHSMIVGSVEYALSTVEVTSDQCETLQRLAYFDCRPGLADAFLGERVMTLMAYDKLDGPHFFGQTRGDDKMLFLDTIRGLREAAWQPWPEAMRRSEAIDNRLHEVLQGNVVQKKVNSIRYMLACLLAPALGAVYKAGARVDWQQDATLVLINLRKYHAHHSRWPDKLDDLVPDYLDAVPVDPFDGQPTRYRANADEVFIWSIGSDGIDNGGTEKKNRAEPDNVMQLRAVPGTSVTSAEP